jgi:uncharacterized protein
MSRKTILITGASSGIGLELAKISAAGGFDLILSARRKTELDKIAVEIEKANGAKVHCIAANLATPDGAAKLAEAVIALGGVDRLINNAGYGLFGDFTQTSLEDELAMMQLNMVSLTTLTKKLLPGLIERRGKVMNVASTASFQPGPLMAVYYASKSYVLSFSEALAEELSDRGVTVTALCPGPTRSGFQDRAAMQDSALVKNKKLPTSAAVALYGFQAMEKGQRVAIHGVLNWIMAQSIRFTPRRVATWAVKQMSKSQA